MGNSLNVYVNGSEYQLKGSTLHDLLVESGIDPTRNGIAVALNDEVVRRDGWKETALNQEDRIEIITAMQGG